MQQAILLFSVLFLTLAMSIPISFSIGITCTIYLLHSGIQPLSFVCAKMFASNDSFVFLAVPLFTLAGNLMLESGMSKKIVNWVDELFGWIPGSYGLITIITCAIFAALTGSGVATVLAVGGLMYPVMVESGYKPHSAAATIAAGGMLGPIIPPSIAMIVYGNCMGVNIADMFLGGAIVGVIIVVLFALWNTFYALRYKIPRNTHTDRSIKNIVKSTFIALPVLAVPVFILGGIYGGIVTASEAATVAVVYTLIYMACTKQLNLQKLGNALKETLVTSASIMFIVDVANGFGAILALEKIPTLIANAVIPYITSPFMYFIILIVILLIAGAVMDTSPAILILAPVLAPIGTSLGIDPLTIGVIFCATIVLGLITPPFGLNLFTICTATKQPFPKVVKGVVPFIICSVLAILLVAAFPQIITSIVK